MVVWNLIFSAILLPLVAIALLARRPRRPRAGWLATLVLSGGIVGFSVFVVPWGNLGVPLRYGVGTLFLVAVVVSLRRNAEAPADESPVRHILKVLIGLFFGGVAFAAIEARIAPAGTLDVGVPLAAGTYLVAHGGSTPAANIHAADPAQQYGVDFVKLNALGFRARGIYPADPHHYFMFDANVVSPCDATVLAASDGVRDTPDPKRGLGNTIRLRCDHSDADVILGHLRRGSIVVRANTRVARGAALAHAGDSGETPEPQLHVHAERNGAAVPLTFGGRWLVRNDVVRR
ncbi:MAG: M23 family metallopeptidase [Acidobacteria bacterium]|nr:M23 family metallopeptidase [Acidobacteriota bacterium]MBV9476190.1 M23 family metallopeptidase [Acidobacteriota bacterium]